MDIFRGKVLAPIQAHQVGIAQEAKHIEVFAALQGMEEVLKHMVDPLIGGSVQDIPQLAILGNRADLKESGQVVALQTMLQSALKLKQGRVLEKHHGKGTHEAIVEAIGDLALPRVRDLFQALGDHFSKRCKTEVLLGMQREIAPIFVVPI